AIEQGEAQATLLFHLHAPDQCSTATTQKQGISFNDVPSGDAPRFPLTRCQPDKSLVVAKLQLNGCRSATESLPVADEAGLGDWPVVLIGSGSGHRSRGPGAGRT